MKKIFLSLLMALTVVMSVAPLTAFAETVPGVYRGTHQCKASESHYGHYGINSEEHDAVLILSENQAELIIEDYDLDQVYSLDNCINANTAMSINFTNDSGYLLLYCWTQPAALNYANCLCCEATGPEMLNLRLEQFGVWDYYDSTLSTGSNWIIPVVTGVLALGAAVYIGKRKSRKDKE